MAVLSPNESLQIYRNAVKQQINCDFSPHVGQLSSRDILYYADKDRAEIRIRHAVISGDFEIKPATGFKRDKKINLRITFSVFLGQIYRGRSEFCVS